MANATRDNNSVPAMLGLLNTDGTTLTLVEADPTTHIIEVSDGTSGSDLSGDNAGRDANSIPNLLATSESDGTTPVPLYVNSGGALLIDST